MWRSGIAPFAPREGKAVQSRYARLHPTILAQGSSHGDVAGGGCLKGDT
jgi:hypothetical protein